MSEDAVFNLNDLALLKGNEKVRQDMVNSIVSKGVPNDPEELTVLLRTLDSSDSSMFKRVNTNIKEAANKTSNAVSNLVSKILLGVDIKTIERSNVNPTTLSANDSKIELLPGEADTGVVDIDYDDFIKE